MNQWLRFLGIAWLGMSIFGLAINLRPFRQEIPWAWIVLWVYPLYQLYQASDFLFREGVLFGLLFHIALAVLGIAGLAMTAPRFFGAGRPNVQPQA